MRLVWSLVLVLIASPAWAQTLSIDAWNGNGYIQSQLVRYKGTIFFCTGGPAFPPGNICPPGIAPDNAPNGGVWNSLSGLNQWNSSVAYAPNAMTVQSGQLYTAIIANTNVDPAGGLHPETWSARSVPSSPTFTDPLVTAGTWKFPPSYVVNEPGTGPMLVDVSGGINSFRPYMLMNLSNATNPQKTGILCQNIEQPGWLDPTTPDPSKPITNECMIAFHFSQNDNGHDASSITTVEWGNGNALEVQKGTGVGPAGLPGLAQPLSRQYGAGISTENFSAGGTSVVSGHGPSGGNSIAFAALVGNTNNPTTCGGRSPCWGEGIRILPGTDNLNMDQRIAIVVTQNQQDLNQIAFANFIMHLDGTILTNNLPGFTGTKTVRAAGGASDCTLVFTNGWLTGGSC